MGKTWNIHRWYSSLHGKKVCRYLPKGNGSFSVIGREWEWVLLFKHRLGICVIEAWPRGTRLGAVSGPPFQWSWPNMKKRQSLTSTAGVKHLAAMETEIFKQHLALVEHCAVRQYDDGDPRETGWITIKVQGAAWCVQVKDPDSCCAFTAVGDSLDKALDTASLLLSCDEAPWEPDVFLQAAKARKKK